MNLNKASSLEIILLTQVLHVSYRRKLWICPGFQLVSAHHAVIFFVNVGLKKLFFSMQITKPNRN